MARPPGRRHLLGRKIRSRVRSRRSPAWPPARRAPRARARIPVRWKKSAPRPSLVAARSSSMTANDESTSQYGTGQSRPQARRDSSAPCPLRRSERRSARVAERQDDHRRPDETWSAPGPARNSGSLVISKNCPVSAGPPARAGRFLAEPCEGACRAVPSTRSRTSTGTGSSE